jgi:transcriptional regulator with AAA-type ATPase domain/transcriptional regulatory protein LevR
MVRKQAVYEFLRKMKNQHGMNAVYTTEEIAGAVGASRANVSSDLNRLFEAELVDKLPGWPVRYRASAAVLTPMPEKDTSLAVDAANEVFDGFIGYNGSMGMEIEKAKAAVLYPLSGLPLLIGGKTGVGKTTFAKLMFEYAKKAGRLKDDARFVSFNCADYANNPQLIMAQLFGCAKGAYTGAEASRDGLVESADGGVLFLDEVHRLPETSQEMLFFLMDYGKYHRLGEADISRKASPIIIMATTEDRSSALLSAFNRRIPIVVTLPPLDQRSPLERLELIRRLFTLEGKKLGKAILVDALAIKALLSYDCPGNVGQLENDIKVACAQSYVSCLVENRQTLNVGLLDLPVHVKEGIRKLKNIYSDINLIARDFSIPLESEDGSRDPQYVSGNLDIYRILARRYEEFSGDNMGKDYLEFVMTTEIKNYFQQLLLNQDEERFGKSGVNEIPSRIYDLARQAEEIITCELGLVLDERSRSVIIQHINAAVSHAGNDVVIYPAFSQVREDRPDVFDAASQIVMVMKQDYGLEPPENEVGIIANLILRIYDEKNQKERCGIIVVCHGLGSAKNMARLANSIVAREFVSWLDVAVEDISAEELSLAVGKKIAELEAYEHLVVLTDSPVLLGLCAELETRYIKKLYLVSDISTSMVIEAAILAVEHRATGQQIRSHLKTMEHGYNELYRLETKNLLSEPKKSFIITACISGCGAAKKLKKIIEDRFDFPEYIEILTLDVPSVQELKQQISRIAGEQELICVIGMVDGLEIGFPFISAMEFVLGNGVQRLEEILQSRCLYQGPRQVQPGSLEEQYASGKYLENYLFYLSAEKTVPYLNECIEKIEKSRGKLDRGKRIMLLLHLASMVERLIFEERNQSAPKKASADLTDACKILETMYRIRIGDEEYKMLEQILALKLGNFTPAEDDREKFTPQKSVLA